MAYNASRLRVSKLCVRQRFDRGSFTQSIFVGWKFGLEKIETCDGQLSNVKNYALWFFEVVYLMLLSEDAFLVDVT